MCICLRILQDELGYCGFFIWIDQLIEALENDKAVKAYGMEQEKDCEIARKSGEKRGRKRQNVDG